MGGEFAPRLPESWEARRLDEVATIIDSLHKTPSYSNMGSPMVRVTDVQGGFLDLSKTLRVSEEVFQEFTRRYAPKKGDMVFSRVGSYGNVCYARTDSPFCLGQNTALISPRINGRFLHLFLQSAEARWQIEQVVVGSTQKTISLKSISAIQIPIPPPDELEAIAAVLGALDDKIELNRQMNATLEAMSRALFQSWFVDFDPVRAKLDGRQPIGFDQGTVALFPEQLEDSKQGPIPRGWRACTLGEIAKNVSITFDFKRTPEVVFINTGDVLEGDFLHSKRSPHNGLPGQAKKSIRPDDILFSEIRPANKRYAYVDFDSSDYVVSTKFMIIRGSKEIHPRLLYRILTAKETLDEFQVQAESRSGTFPQITFDSISHLSIVLPPIEIQEAFQRAVGKMDAQIQVNKKQSSTLATLRDTLLPKLLSGELSVPSGLLAVEDSSS
jgi:type I restriction enzyme, S subunit